MIDSEIIGQVISNVKEPVNQPVIQENLSTIRIFPQFVEGLWKLEESRHIEIVYIFHLSEGYNLICNTFTGERKGVFATHNPNRPSKTGITVAELLNVYENELLVKGLDALDGSPVIDIRPYLPKTGNREVKSEYARSRMNNPRMDIMPVIWEGDTEGMMGHAARLHGHRCPWLTLGVMISHFALGVMREKKWQLAACRAMIPPISGFIDGVQMITGLTLGNGCLTIDPEHAPGITISCKTDETISIKINQDLSPDPLQLSTFSEFDCLKIHDTINYNYPEGSRLKQQLINQSLYLQSIHYNKLFSVI